MYINRKTVLGILGILLGMGMYLSNCSAIIEPPSGSGIAVVGVLLFIVGMVMLAIGDETKDQ